MKLYADIVFRNEDGVEISRVVQEETRQYMGFEFTTIHEFFFNWKVGESCARVDIIGGEDKNE